MPFFFFLNFNSNYFEIFSIRFFLAKKNKRFQILCATAEKGVIKVETIQNITNIKKMLRRSFGVWQEINLKEVVNEKMCAKFDENEFRS